MMERDLVVVVVVEWEGRGLLWRQKTSPKDQLCIPSLSALEISFPRQT